MSQRSEAVLTIWDGMWLCVAGAPELVERLIRLREVEIEHGIDCAETSSCGRFAFEKCLPRRFWRSPEGAWRLKNGMGAGL